MGHFWLLTFRYVIVAAFTLVLGIIGAKFGIFLRKKKNAKEANAIEVDNTSSAE